MTISELKEIALHAAKGTVPACFANQDVDVKLYNNGKNGLASINLILSDNTKEITSSFDYTGLNENIHLSRGFNKILVKWDEDSNMIEVNRAI